MAGARFPAYVDERGRVVFLDAAGGLIMHCMQRIQHCTNLQQAIIAAFPNIVTQRNFATDVRSHVVVLQSRVALLARVLTLYKSVLSEDAVHLWNFCREIVPGCLADPSDQSVDLVGEINALRNEAPAESFHRHGYLRAAFVRAAQDIHSGLHEDLAAMICAAFPNVVTPSNFSEDLLLRVLENRSRLVTLRAALSHSNDASEPAMALSAICQFAADSG